MFNVSEGLDDATVVSQVSTQGHLNMIYNFGLQGCLPRINLYKSCTEMWYMDAYPGHYGTCTCTYNMVYAHSATSPWLLFWVPVW